MLDKYTMFKRYYIAHFQQCDLKWDFGDSAPRMETWKFQANDEVLQDSSATPAKFTAECNINFTFLFPD